MLISEHVRKRTLPNLWASMRDGSMRDGRHLEALAKGLGEVI